MNPVEQELAPISTVAPSSPGWLVHLEKAHDLAQRALRALEAITEPVVDLAPAGEAIARALVATYDAVDGRTPRVEAVERARIALEEARGASLDPTLGAAREAIDGALRSMAAVRERVSAIADAPKTYEGLRASGDRPRLHAIRRPSLSPSIRLAPPPSPPIVEEAPLKPPTSIEELDAMVKAIEARMEARAKGLADVPPPFEEGDDDAREGPPGFVAKVGRALSEGDFVRLKMRELFEEAAMLAIQRTPILGEAYRNSRILENRLLKTIDAIVAFGPRAIGLVEPLVFDAPAKDASRVTGATWILGSLAGRDAIAAAERVARYCGCADPAIANAYAGALKLVPHPDLNAAMRTMLADPDPIYRAIALDVLAYRRLATPEDLVNALGDAPEIAAIALPPLALARYPYLERALEPALASDHPRLREAAWIAMAFSGHRWTASILEKELSGPFADRAAQHLAIVAQSEEATRFYAKVQEKPTEPLVAALGWLGLLDSVPWLVGVLAGKHDDAVKIAAAWALDRITGAQLYESVLVDPEKVAFPDAGEPDLGEAPRPKPLAAMVSDPRDLPSDGTPDTLVRPTTEAPRWRSWWQQMSIQFDRKQRHRRGHPYAPVVSLWELDGWIVTPAERRVLQRELVVRTGEWVPFDPHDWVVEQEASLKRWEPIAKRASAAAGSWTLPHRG